MSGKDCSMEEIVFRKTVKISQVKSDLSKEGALVWKIMNTPLMCLLNRNCCLPVCGHAINCKDNIYVSQVALSDVQRVSV